MAVDPGVFPIVFEWGFKILLAVGGVGGLTALFLVRAQKRKVVSESGKTDAEADSILADASAKKTDRESRILDMSEKLLVQMQDRLEDAEIRIDRLTEYIEVLVQALRTGGQPVPNMPQRMAEEAHAGSQARTDVTP